MGKLAYFGKHNIPIFLFVIFLASCSYREFIYLKNHTKQEVLVRVQFNLERRHTGLDFALKPDDGDAWQYEVGYFDKGIFDKALEKITFKSENGCQKSYSRKEIADIAFKRGMWQIHINQQLIGCE